MAVHQFDRARAGTQLTSYCSYRLLEGLDLPATFPRPQQCPEGWPDLDVPTPGSGFPVYVMLPLDTVWLADRDGHRVSVVKREQALQVGLQMLKNAGVEGIMIDVWWGIVEHAGPQQYDFSAYQRLFATAAQAGLKIQAVMSFHAAGGNVGDTCKISLPDWISEIGSRNPDIYYTDKQGYRNKECLSLGCDTEPLFWGRTPVDMYRDFISAFADTFDDLAGTSTKPCVEVLALLGTWFSSSSDDSAADIAFYCSMWLHSCLSAARHVPLELLEGAECYHVLRMVRQLSSVSS